MDPYNSLPTPDDPTPFTPTAQEAGDATLLVKFYTKAKQDHEKSVLYGRPVFKDVEYIDIRVPGSNAGAARPATARDKARFPRHYEAFQKRQEMPEEGTPLAQWPPMSRSMVEQLAFINVKTVEQLAAVPDSSLKNVMGLAKFKQLAQQFIDAAKSDAPLVKLQAELHERDNKLAAQEQTIAQLTARLEALETAQQGGEAQAEAEPPHLMQRAVVPELPNYKSVLDGGAEGEDAPVPAADDAPQSTPEAPRRERRPRRKPISE